MKTLGIALWTLTLWAGTLAPSAAFAVDLGVHGRLYEIEEDNLLDVLMARAQQEVDSGRWAERVKEWGEQAKAQTARPAGIELPRADKTASHLFDPSIIVPEDIRDAAGNVLRPKGTRVNPLDYISMTRTLVFIDGDDAEQVEWMVSQTAQEPDRYKVILTRGNVLDLAKQTDRRLFFDQRQVYTRKLSIQSLPAVVYQEGAYLRIDEVALP